MLSWERINCFENQEDGYTITSKKYIWKYPTETMEVMTEQLL